MLTQWLILLFTAGGASYISWFIGCKVPRGKCRLIYIFITLILAIVTISVIDLQFPLADSMYYFSDSKPSAWVILLAIAGRVMVCGSIVSYKK